MAEGAGVGGRRGGHRQPGAPDAVAAAIALAGRGFAVFPLRRGSKTPAVRADWEGVAATDPAAVRALFRAPRSNIAIACGPSGLLVVDLDVVKHAVGPAGGPGRQQAAESDTLPADSPHNRSDAPVRCGADTLRAIAAGREIPATFTVATPTGGLHLYFRRPEGVTLRNTAGRLGALIDTRACGGYVVAPGSVINGAAYTILADRPIAPLPDWLVHALTRTSPALPDPAGVLDPAVLDPRLNPRGDALRTERSYAAYAAAALRGEVRRVRDARPGTRNDTLNRAAYSLGQLVGAGLLDHDRALGELHDAARAIDLPPREAAATIRSGLTAGSHRPRRITPVGGAVRPGGEKAARTTAPAPSPKPVPILTLEPGATPRFDPDQSGDPRPVRTHADPVAEIADQRAWARTFARHGGLREPIGAIRHELARHEIAAGTAAAAADGTAPAGGAPLSVDELIRTLRRIDAVYEPAALHAAGALSRVPAWRRLRALADALRDLRDEIENGAPGYAVALDREARLRTALRGLLGEACTRAGGLAAAIDAGHPEFCPPRSPIRLALADLREAFAEAGREILGAGSVSIV